MTDAQVLTSIRRVIEREQRPIGDRAEALVAEIRRKHGGVEKALLFYGSSLRAGEAAGKMLDFYVLVNSYRDVHGIGLKQLGSFLAPPSVHYCEAEGPDGERLRSKYSIVSLSAFRRRARGAALESMLWARFAQPTLLICNDPKRREDLVDTLAHATHHFLAETAPLLRGDIEKTAIWERGLMESYRTELRPEDAVGRSKQIVAKHTERYQQLSEVMFSPGISGSTIQLPDVGTFRRNFCRLRWIARRVIGKPMGAFRVLKAFFTFDAGLDYVLEKIKSHSGAEIEVSDHARKYPLLHAPVLAWRLFRKGAFR
ncbi:MAG: hypothetical protein QNI84_02245 [Henriciella sp.]|nr:hypothetical protein [Henriciella sp.]